MSNLEAAINDSTKGTTKSLAEDLLKSLNGTLNDLLIQVNHAFYVYRKLHIDGVKWPEWRRLESCLSEMANGDLLKLARQILDIILLVETVRRSLLNEVAIVSRERAYGKHCGKSL